MKFNWNWKRGIVSAVLLLLDIFLVLCGNFVFILGMMLPYLLFLPRLIETMADYELTAWFNPGALFIFHLIPVSTLLIILGLIIVFSWQWGKLIGNIYDSVLNKLPESIKGKPIIVKVTKN